MESELVFQIFKQLALATFLGGIIGIERWFRRKPAGLRTYALVSLGACLFTIISLYGFVDSPDYLALDPSRIISQIVVSVGFLGGGIVFRNEKVSQGLTTAAGLWVAAGIGTTVGLKMYPISLITTCIALVIFFVLYFFENKLPQDGHNE